MECCNKWWKAIILLIVGLIFIYTQLYTTMNIWVVIGVLIIIKAIVVAVMPSCCDSKKKK